MRYLASILFFVWSAAAAVVSGTVRDPDGQPIAGATVRVDAGSQTKSGDDGAYRLTVDGAREQTLTAEFDGFVPVQQTVVAADRLSLDLKFAQIAPTAQSTTVVADENGSDIQRPDPGQRFYIRDEMLDGNPGRPGAPISIPGLPVETASGGIKAPQYFAPGVAGDHGEPIAQFFQVGNYLVPNNLSANAHGNGYADPNIIIPATIESVETDAGAFNVLEGNHAVNLGVTYGLRSRLEPFVTVTSDPHDIDVAAGWSPGGPATRAWIAVEAAYGDGFLKAPEHRQQYKINGFRVFDLHQHQLTLFGIGYYGESRIPGLVPINVSGLNDTIDPRQRDQTHTGEIAASDVWHLNSADQIRFRASSAPTIFRCFPISATASFGRASSAPGPAARRLTSRRSTSFSPS